MQGGSLNGKTVSSSGGANYCISNLAAYNFSMELNVTFSNNSASLGVIFRATNLDQNQGAYILILTPNNLAMWRIDPGGNKVKIGNGRQDIPLSANRPYHLRIVASKTAIQVFLDNHPDNPVIDRSLINDASSSGAAYGKGVFGFYAEGSNLLVDFRNVRVEVRD